MSGDGQWRWLHKSPRWIMFSVHWVWPRWTIGVCVCSPLVAAISTVAVGAQMVHTMTRATSGAAHGLGVAVAVPSTGEIHWRRVRFLVWSRGCSPPPHIRPRWYVACLGPSTIVLNNCLYVCMCMNVKLINQIVTIRETKKFTKPNCNICM